MEGKCIKAAERGERVGKKWVGYGELGRNGDKNGRERRGEVRSG